TRSPEAAPARTAATVAVAARREPPPHPVRTTNVVASARASTTQAAQPVMYTQAPPATPAEAVARIARGAPVDLSQPAVASALGAARPALAPPVPVSSAVAATL